MQKLITELGIKEKVFFKEGICDNELRGLYQNAELFLLLSQADNHDVEGFGIVYLEAAAFGLPVIATYGCGAEDAVLNGENGYLFDASDIEKIAERILEIFKNQNLRQRLSLKSIEFAKENSNQKMVGKYLDVYNYVSRSWDSGK